MLYGASSEISPIQYGQILDQASYLNPGRVTNAGSRRSSRPAKEPGLGNPIEVLIYFAMGKWFEDAGVDLILPSWGFF